MPADLSKERRVSRLFFIVSPLRSQPVAQSSADYGVADLSRSNTALAVTTSRLSWPALRKKQVRQGSLLRWFATNWLDTTKPQSRPSPTSDPEIDRWLR